MQPSPRPFRLWPYLLGSCIGLLAGLLLFIFLGARNIDDRTRQWVIGELSARFDSDVELQSLHVDTTPRMQVTGEGLSLRYHGRAGVPPLIQIARFSFNLGFLGIVHVPRHIKGVYVENMIITIPPSDPNAPPAPPTKSAPVPRLIFNEIVCNDTDLIILPRKTGKPPLDFAIHDLVLKNVGDRKPFDFRGTLTNAKPKGEIATTGTFGPWNAADPAFTPLSGHYNFSGADLDPFAGIGGTLSSTGDYTGHLNQIEVQGQTDTPNFSLDPIGRPVPLHTEFSATVDGTDGDTYLHPVRATLLHSLIIANGSVIRAEGQPGHIISLNIYAPNARLQDILRLATKSAQPVMTGSVNLKAKMLLSPGKEKVIHRLSLDGDFGVNDAEFASVDVRDKLESLSRHALGKPNDEDAGSAVTDLLGHFRLDRDLASFPRLSFSIPGAEVRLTGKYHLPTEELDFQGNLRMRAKLSQTVTGKKSFFLKLADPFFKKDGAGSVVPIRITGTRDAPKFALDLFHKSAKE
ncbi:MAG TPA: AsmA-like C-terminal region-containing protein [Candidatus Acidoferrum sp.]|nr:AsmA-like C-terminal region-containing protein [Candidatus Acidoferrum sp.]